MKYSQKLWEKIRGTQKTFFKFWVITMKVNKITSAWGEGLDGWEMLLGESGFKLELEDEKNLEIWQHWDTAFYEKWRSF